MINYIDKNNTYIDDSVIIENGVTIYPNVFITGTSIIKEGTIIYPNTYIEDSTIGCNNVIKSSNISNSSIGNENMIGPNSYIRNNTNIMNNTKIGFSVEIKNSVIGTNTKIQHLTYVGDSIIGNNVNVGASCVTANYDGATKHKTIIEDDCFIGSGVILIAPIKVEKNSFIAAGSTINKDIPKNTFSIARERQVNKNNRYSKDCM